MTSVVYHFPKMPLRTSVGELSDEQATECQAILNQMMEYIYKRHAEIIDQMETEVLLFGKVQPETADKLRREMEVEHAT